MSMGGLEPPQIAPHAPQACTSTIPPHRLTLIIIKKSANDKQLNLKRNKSGINY